MAAPDALAAFLKGATLLKGVSLLKALACA